MLRQCGGIRWSQFLEQRRTSDQDDVSVYTPYLHHSSADVFDVEPDPKPDQILNRLEWVSDENQLRATECMSTTEIPCPQIAEKEWQRQRRLVG
jgi:hypothetical protein